MSRNNVDYFLERRGVDCEPSSRNLQTQHQQSTGKETISPAAPLHRKSEVASILFSQAAILNGEGAIFCENPGGGSEHSTDPVAPPVGRAR